MIEKVIGDNAFSISPRPEMRKFRTRRNIERSRGASGVRHGFSLSSRGVDRWKPLSCIPVTPYPVATWVKPRINQVSLSWFTDSGVQITSPMGKAHRSRHVTIVRPEERGSI